ncbi:MAG: nucleotidyltransferase family protein [Clostridia bacterium]|nr:nucleotidyltransferase family protein [Clostridia bacterium]
MNNTEKLLIEILSAFVNGKSPAITTEYDASELYELAKAQSVLGITGYILNKYDQKEILSAEKRLADVFDKTVIQLVRIEFSANRILKLLNSEGIKHIIFKGLVVKECYPVPELRTFGDVDIIIREEDREKIHNLMCRLGFRYQIMDGGEVCSYIKGAEHYEFHTTLNSEKIRLSDNLADFWNYTRQKDGLTFEFTEEFHLCYLISHIEKHVYGTGAGVRMYLDIALFLNRYKDKLDLNRIRELLKECELEEFLDSVLYLCQQWFGTDVKPIRSMSRAVYHEFCRYTFKGGVFGLMNKDDVAQNEVRQAIRSKGKLGKLFVILSHIFPSYRELKRMYPFFNGKPYLLPAGWVVHFFKAFKRSGLKNIRTIASVNMQKARNEKELLEKIGSKR